MAVARRRHLNPRIFPNFLWAIDATHSPYTLNGSDYSQIDNWGSASLNFAQGTASKQPAQITGNKGNKAAQFVSADSQEMTSADNALYTPTTYSVFFVLEDSTPKVSDNNQYWWKETGSQYIQLWSVAGSTTRHVYGRDYKTADQVTVDLDDAYAVDTVQVLMMENNNSTLDLYQNSGASTIATNTKTNAPVDTSATAYIGSYSSGGHAGMKFYGTYWFNAVTTGQRHLLFHYFNWRFR